MAHFDLIIRHGEVYDGTGAPSQQLDIAIKDGMIAALSPHIDATAASEIDASGKVVTPGFIDVHTHFDGQATWDSQMSPSSNLGTTTVVMGNCGVGFAPCRPEDREVLVQLMEGVEEIPGTALAEGLPWTWETFPQFLDTLEAKARDIDVAALVPHGPLRVFVMGERAVNREAATPADIKEMKRLLAEGVAAGGMGFSTSRTMMHRSSTGAQVPTYLAATSELKQLGEALSGARGHVFQLISDWEEPEDEFSILRETSAKTGAKGTFTLVHQDYQPTLLQEQLARIEQAQADGLDIRGQVLSRPVGMLMGHPTTFSPFYKRPTFTSLDSLPPEAKLEQLRRPEIKARILAERNVAPNVFVEIMEEHLTDMYPLEDPIDYLPRRDSNIKARADAEGVHPESWLYDWFLGNDGKNLVYIPSTNFFDGIPELLRHPNTVMALGDGGAHVGTICDASAYLYVLTKWVKETQAIDLAQAIHLLTRQPAELYSLNDRGLIAPGMKADLNVIDFDALKLHSPHIVFDLPAGGKRLNQNADGINATIVSGVVTFEDGKATGALPGKLIRGQRMGPAAHA